MSQPSPTMSLMQHLDELRKRLLVVIVVLVATTSFTLAFAQQMLEILARPIGGLSNLQAIEVTENISVFMRVSLLGGVILGMPVVVYELLMFILPGLQQNEKRWVYFAVPAATLLFAGGILFAYFVMLPAAIPFLVDKVIAGVSTKPRISNYINFISNMMFWIGLSFETPLLSFVLAKLNLVTAAQLLKGWRVALVVIAIIAAAATPTVDPVNMGLLMAPLFVLYMLSVGLAYAARPRS